MTVPSSSAEPPRNEYTEDGVTLVHAINFTFENDSEIVVSRITGDADAAEILLVNPTHYTVAGGLGETGSITKTNGGVVGAKLRIDRKTPIDQLTDYEPGDDFPAESHERALDKLTRILQELARDLLSREDVRDIIGALLVAGDGISITIDDAGNKITIASTFDVYSKLKDILHAGSGITIQADDVLETLTLTAAGLESLPACVKLSGDQQDGGGGGGSSPITGEQIQDIVGAMIGAGAGIGVVYDDATGTLLITNTSPSGYTDENARDAIGAALVAGTQVSISVNDAGDQITINCTALAASYRGLVVDAEAGAFNFTDDQGGKSILYTGGPASATLRPQSVHALSDGWGTVIHVAPGAGPLAISLGAGVSLFVNGATVSSGASLAAGAVASINRWGADNFTIVGPKVA